MLNRKIPDVALDVGTQIATVEPFTIRVGRRNQLLARIETRDGLVGWGNWACPRANFRWRA